MVIEVKQKDEVCLLSSRRAFRRRDGPEYLRVRRNEIKGLNCKKVLADFREVSDIGSAGIGFIRWHLHIHQELRWAFHTGGPEVREVFDLTRVSTVIPMAADIASGLVTLCDESLAAEDPQE